MREHVKLNSTHLGASVAGSTSEELSSMARIINSASSLFTRSYAVILALALSLFLAGSVSAQNPNELTYIYDELGRLIAVVDPAGETVKYTYDVVGNLLSITRHNSSQLSIIKVQPDSGP
ncbi:MAG: RHS repeat protein, partial [Pyrinomonadaceae bacterium]|nr:RHS repeat protein [Pyrinomonadaceae bacterium]